MSNRCEYALIRNILVSPSSGYCIHAAAADAVVVAGATVVVVGVVVGAVGICM